MLIVRPRRCYARSLSGRVIEVRLRPRTWRNGRRKGLKIPREETPVPVRSPAVRTNNLFTLDTSIAYCKDWLFTSVVLHMSLQNDFVALSKMPRIATKLAPAHKGGFIARKVIPHDVREDYAKLYGQRTEERLNTGPMRVSLARAKHREWSSEIEARIANIRAGRRGDGCTLTPKEARALAGEWYSWFTARMAAHNWRAETWQDYEWHAVRSQLYGPAMERGVFSGDPPIFGSGTAACATVSVQSSPMKRSLSSFWRRGDWCSTHRRAICFSIV